MTARYLGTWRRSASEEQRDIDVGALAAEGADRRAERRQAPLAIIRHVFADISLDKLEIRFLTFLIKKNITQTFMTESTIADLSCANCAVTTESCSSTVDAA